ncbi:MAG: nuclear transport factor 2 family protein [Deltaproteobacteria bacterium]|nr:nuclear transport factor 2 family protein [Deltaproteobacteria bacterium]
MNATERRTEEFVHRIHDAARKRDIKALDALIADEITFYTPRFFKPLTDRRHIIIVLSGIYEIFQDLEFYRTFLKANEAIIEYKARIGELTIHGVDIFTLDDAGKAKELTVMLRPAKALTALGEIEDKFVREHLSNVQ